MKILVTDGDFKNTLGIVRSLGRQGHQVSVLVARGRRKLADCSRFCSAVELVPHLTVENFAGVVLRVLERTQYDLLMPVGYNSTLAAARSKGKITSLTRLEVAEAAKIELAADKKRVHELALKLGLNAPASFYPSSMEEAAELAGELNYPVVLKVASESTPHKGIRIAKSQEEFMPSLESLRAAWPSVPPMFPMVQTFVPGYGCGFFALYQNGVCKRVFMHRRIREYPPSGGVSCCAESFYDPALKEAGIKLLDAMNWHGVAMVEFRYDPVQEKYALLEVNAKFWGSLDLALAAGADFPRYLCQMASGEALSYEEDYRYPLRYHWPLSGEIQHFFKRPAAFGSIAADLLNPRVKSNLWLSDLEPNAQEFLSLLRILRRRVLKG
jgi:predicted ATP-grasp superfamily ATP-dependent carboligase